MYIAHLSSAATYSQPRLYRVFVVIVSTLIKWGVVKYKPSALFQNLCGSCMSVRTLLLLSCVHSLELGLDLGNSLNQRGENARALIHELQSCRK